MYFYQSGKGQEGQINRKKWRKFIFFLSKRFLFLFLFDNKLVDRARPLSSRQGKDRFVTLDLVRHAHPRSSRQSSITTTSCIMTARRPNRRIVWISVPVSEPTESVETEVDTKDKRPKKITYNDKKSCKQLYTSYNYYRNENKCIYGRDKVG